MTTKREDLNHLNEYRMREIYANTSEAWYLTDKLQHNLRVLAKTKKLETDGNLKREIVTLENMKIWLKAIREIVKYKE
jgi:hypothetical protein